MLSKNVIFKTIDIHVVNIVFHFNLGTLFIYWIPVQNMAGNLNPVQKIFNVEQYENS